MSPPFPHVELEEVVPVPVSLLRETVDALRTGADAFLDRDWDLYTEPERIEAEQFVEARFDRLVEALERILR